VYRLGSVIPLLIAIFAAYYSLSSLSLGELTDPGAGLWPFIVSVSLLLSSLALLVTERSNEDYERFASSAWVVALGVSSVGMFILLFERIGFLIPGFLTLVIWLRFLGRESWRSTLIISALSMAGFYLLFVTLLGIPLPRGIYL
jgi:putative tricarboxylic transport membrane protein